MTLVVFSAFLLLIVIFGLLITMLFRSTDIKEIIGNSVLLGFLLVTLIFFVDYQIFSIFQVKRVAAFLSIISVTTIIVYRKSLVLLLNSLSVKGFRRLNKTSQLLLALIVVYLFSTLILNYIWPINDWDAIALYDFRSKLMETGSWQDGIKLGYFFHYPPFTSLLHGIAYLLNFERAKVLYSFLYAAFLLTFYALLRRRFSTVRAMMGTFLLTIAPLSSGHVLIAYTNLPYTIYFSLGVIYTWEWLRLKRKSDLLYSIFFISSSLWIRQAEPFWIVPLSLIVFHLLLSKRKGKISTLFSGLFVFIGFYKYWPTYVNSLDLPTVNEVYANTQVKDIPITLGRIFNNTISVSMHLFTYLFKPLAILIIPLLFVLFLDKSFKFNKQFCYELGTLVAFIVMIGTGTFVFSFTYDTWRQIGESLVRMIMFLEPLIIYILMSSSLWFFNEKK